MNNTSLNEQYILRKGVPQYSDSIIVSVGAYWGLLVDIDADLDPITHISTYIYRKVSNISRTNSQILDASRLIW